MDRAIELLEVVHEFLDQIYERGYIDDITEETVHYDDTDCDVLCLLDDIACVIEDNKNNK